MQIFHEFEKHGLIRDDLCFDPEHFMRTVIVEHWHPKGPSIQQIKDAYKEFDDFYEENEISPYNAAYDYFHAGVDWALNQAHNGNVC